MADDNDRTSAEFKAWEAHMRRRLASKGLTLNRSRTRLPMATEFGPYAVSEGGVSLSHGYTLGPHDVNRWANER